MSIDPAAATPSAQQFSSALLLPLVFAPVGLFVAWLLGAFRARSIDGPARTEAGDPIGRLWAVTFLGFFTWALVPALYLQFVLPAAGSTSTSTATPATMAATTPAAATNPVADLPASDKLRMYILAQVSAVFVLLLANAATSPHALRRLGLNVEAIPRGVLYGFLGALAAIPLTIAASAAVQLVLQVLQRPTPQDHELIQVFRSAPSQVRGLVVLSAALLAPVFEEMFFRGHLQTAMAATLNLLRPAPQATAQTGEIVTGDGGAVLDYERAPVTLPRTSPPPAVRWLSIAVVSLLFASVHGMNWMFGPLFLLSLCLGYAYERTGNLWVPMTMHASFNLLSLALVTMSV